MKTHCVTAALCASVLLGPLTSVARAQHRDNYGNGYNNSTSALLGTLMNRNAMNRSREAGSAGVSDSIRREADLQEARGQRLIKAGRATTRFPMRPFPLDVYMTRDWNGDKETREKYLREYQAQSVLWKQEMTARNAKTGDMGDAYALAMVLCCEAYTGQRVSNAGFAQMARYFGAAWRDAPYYQGGTVTDKQDRYEKTMLSASYALYMRRTGDTTGAQAEAKKFMDKWWEGGTPSAIKTLKPFTNK